MNIKIKEKIYTSGPLTMSITREAMRIFADWTKTIGKTAELKTAEPKSNVGDLESIKAISSLLEENADLLERKCELLVRVYKNQFTLDELYESLTTAEVETEFIKIINSINGAIEKNA